LINALVEASRLRLQILAASDVQLPRPALCTVWAVEFGLGNPA
jgi:hypothetical protein